MKKFFTGKNDERYALVVSKTEVWEIHRWEENKKRPKNSRWVFYKATGTPEFTARMMLSLCTGDVVAADVQSIITAWENAVERILQEL